ncbi:hypothetical protein ACFXPZ_05885 [Streptomyces sp. NPDC059101]|uniref:hypothetical protein n=1 Tax=Streptomyces sp. NPDC059101 TaxID=3346728 RepID=UPI003698D537
MGAPGSADQAADGDDRVGEVEEGFDDGDPPFEAACEPVEGVLPGVGALWNPRTRQKDAPHRAARHHPAGLFPGVLVPPVDVVLVLRS